MIEFDTTDIPAERGMKSPEPPRNKPEHCILPEGEFKSAESGGSEIMTSVGNVSMLHVQNSEVIYNRTIDDIRKSVSEGMSPEEAFRHHKVPCDPRVKKMLLTSILLDQNSTYDFPAELKKAVLESQTFRMFIEATQKGDHANAQRWARLLGEDPALGRHVKQVEVRVKRDGLTPFLEEAEDVEIIG